MKIDGRRIDVAGHSWLIKTFDPQSRQDGAMGRSDSKLGIISISSDLDGPMQESTLIHEWVHGILEIYGVAAPEEVATVLGNELYRQGFELPIHGAHGEQGGEES